MYSRIDYLTFTSQHEHSEQYQDIQTSLHYCKTHNYHTFVVTTSDTLQTVQYYKIPFHELIFNIKPNTQSFTISSSENTQLIQEDTRIAFYGAQNNTTPVTKGNYTLKKLEKEKDNLFQKISASKFRHYKHLPNTNKCC